MIKFKFEIEDKIIEEDNSDVEDEMEKSPYYEKYQMVLRMNKLINELNLLFVNNNTQNQPP